MAKVPKIRSAPSSPRRCYRCGQAGHVSFQCSWEAPEERPVASPKAQRTPYVQQRAGYIQPQVPRTPPRGQRSNQLPSPSRGPGPRCFLCNRVGHIARNCLIKPAAAVEVQSQGKAFERSREEVADAGQIDYRDCAFCKAHSRKMCPECLVLEDPSHHCQASSMSAFCQDCGVRFPVVADACQSPDKLSKMPVAEGLVEGTPVKVCLLYTSPSPRDS